MGTQRDQAVRSGSGSLCTLESDYSDTPSELAVDEVLRGAGTALNLCPRVTSGTGAETLSNV